jgi:signal transduction histidine kinase
LLDVFLLAMVTVGVVVIVRAVRRSDDLGVRIVAGGLGVLIAGGLYDSLVDDGIVKTPYLSPFALVALVLGGATYLTTQGAAVERRLREEAVDLRGVTIEQATALVEARRRLERRAGPGHTLDDDLEGLATGFERLNALANASAERPVIMRSVQVVLGTIGSLMKADQVTLKWAPPEDCPDAVTETLSWTIRGRGVVEPCDVRSEALRIGVVQIGTLSVETRPDKPPTGAQRSFLALVAELLASYFHQLQLAETIASTAIVAERHRLARELHDSVTQRLYSAAFLAEALPRLVEHDPQTSAQTAERIRSIVLSSLAELRSSLFELRPLELDAATIDGLLRRLAENVSGSTGASIDVCAEPGDPLPADVKLGLYRIAQQAVSNSVRHSGCDRIEIGLTRNNSGVRLEVRDDGCGFMSEGDCVGHGLHSITERAHLIDGELRLESAPGRGTTVIVEWPRPASPNNCQVATTPTAIMTP